MNPIVGIGELLWDVFPDGRKVAGGAPFNFTFHCKQLGHDAVMVSRVGDDDLGRELREEVRRLGLSDEFIQTDYEHPTGTVRVSVDANGQPSYTITKDVAWDYIGWDGSLDSLTRSAKAVCFGTLGLRSAGSQECIKTVVGKVRTSGGLCVLDPNFRPPFLPDLQTLKWCHELSNWVKIGPDEDLRAIWESWDDNDPFPEVQILTGGSVGCEIWTLNGDQIRVPGLSVKVVDTVGAGDAFIAAMVCMYLEGQSLAACACFANHYAARVCEHQGGTPRIDRADVERAAFG